jgi:hypothetical protein
VYFSKKPGTCKAGAAFDPISRATCGVVNVQFPAQAARARAAAAR